MNYKFEAADALMALGATVGEAAEAVGATYAQIWNYRKRVDGITYRRRRVDVAAAQAMRDQGFTFREIGSDQGFTRQAVQQALQAARG